MHRSFVLSVFFILFFSHVAFAEKIREVDTFLQSKADTYVGKGYRLDVNKATVFAQRGDDQAAWAALAPALAFCGQQISGGDTKMLSVSDTAEAEESMASAEPGITVTFVDFACPSAYKTAAFLAVRANDASAAFNYLDKAQQLAPYWAEPVAERAYLVGKLGDRPASLAMYKTALGLAEKYPASAYVKPLILRGIGFALIELGNLDEAQLAFETSLRLDPSSELAKSELIYIEQQRDLEATSADH